MNKAYVLIVNESGTEDSVISNLQNIQNISDAYGTFGSYDILTKLESESEDEIQKSISNHIRKIPHIRSTLTLLVDKKPGISKTSVDEQKILDKHMAQAFVMIHCAKSDEGRILKDLESIPEVVVADLLIGTYEIICRIAAPTYNEISEIVSRKIRKIPEIKSTITINAITDQGFSR